MARWVLVFVAVLAVQAHGSVVSDFVDNMKAELLQESVKAEQYILLLRQQMEALVNEEVAKIAPETEKLSVQLEVDVKASGQYGLDKCVNLTRKLVVGAVKELEHDSRTCVSSEIQTIETIIEDMVAQVKVAVDTVSTVQGRISACMEHPITSIPCAMLVVDDTKTTLKEVRDSITDDISKGVDTISNFGEHTRDCLGTVYHSIPDKMKKIEKKVLLCVIGQA